MPADAAVDWTADSGADWTGDAAADWTVDSAADWMMMTVDVLVQGLQIFVSERKPFDQRWAVLTAIDHGAWKVQGIQYG